MANTDTVLAVALTEMYMILTILMVVRIHTAAMVGLVTTHMVVTTPMPLAALRPR